MIVMVTVFTLHDPGAYGNAGICPFLLRGKRITDHKAVSGTPNKTDALLSLLDYLELLPKAT